MLWSFVLIGGGAWVVSSVLNRAMAGPSPLVMGRYPTNQLVAGLGVLGLLLAPVFGPLAGLVSFASALGATGGVISIMNQSGIQLIPRAITSKMPQAISGDYPPNVVAGNFDFNGAANY